MSLRPSKFTLSVVPFGVTPTVCQLLSIKQTLADKNKLFWYFPKNVFSSFFNNKKTINKTFKKNRLIYLFFSTSCTAHENDQLNSLQFSLFWRKCYLWELFVFWLLFNTKILGSITSRWHLLMRIFWQMELISRVSGTNLLQPHFMLTMTINVFLY